MIILLFSGIVLLMGCTRYADVAHNREKSAGEAKPLLALSIPPQNWFARRIASDRVRTVTLVGPAQNPHSYEPTPAQMKDLSQAGAWVLSGAEFEISLVQKVQGVFSSLAIIDGTEGVSFRIPDDWHGNDNHFDDSHSYEHGVDRHTWLGCAPAKILAAHIRDALVLLDPTEKELYNKNYADVIIEIDHEFTVLRNELLPLKGSSVYVYHPGFGYFLDEFGIRQKAVESGGKEPGPRELAGLIDEMKLEKAAAIFVQAQFPVNVAKTVAQATGARLVSLDPLSEDWPGTIRVMGNVLKNAASDSGQAVRNN